MNNDFKPYNFDNELWILDFSGKNSEINKNVITLAWMNSIEDLNIHPLLNLVKLYYYYSFTRCPGNILYVPYHINYLFLDGNLSNYYDLQNYKQILYLKLSFFFIGKLENISKKCKILFCKIINYDISYTNIEQIYCNCAMFEYLPYLSLQNLSIQNCLSISGIEKLKNLKILHLGDWFNSPIHNLSELDNCIELKFGKNFNQSIDNFLPKNLKKLFISSIFFNYSCSYLPSHLEYFEILSIKPIDLTNLPTSLIALKICHQNLCFLPNGIKTIYTKILKSPIENIIHLPNSVQKIYVKKIYIDIENLPSILQNKINKIY